MPGKGLKSARKRPPEMTFSAPKSANSASFRKCREFLVLTSQNIGNRETLISPLCGKTALFTIHYVLRGQSHPK